MIPDEYGYDNDPDAWYERDNRKSSPWNDMSCWDDDAPDELDEQGAA